MEQSKKKTNLLSDGASQHSVSRLQPSTSRGRESQKLGMLLQRPESDSDDERGAYPLPTPRSSLVGVQITDDDRALFFSRRSAMAAMFTENPSLLPPRGSGRTQNPSVHTMLQINAVGASSRLPSGLLYPCNSGTGDPNSCQLSAAHFTFDSAILAPDQSNHDNLTERIFKKLMGQSKQQQRGTSKSPISTLDCPASPASSERSFRGKSKKKSLRCRSEDANNTVVAAPRPKSQLAQYLRSMTAMSGDHDDDRDELEGPSEAAWLDPDSPCHESGKKLESWSSSNSSWNLSLNPLKSIVARRGGTPGRRDSGSRFRKAIAQNSLTGSYDGSRVLRKGVGSEMSSGRSWWSDFGSGRKSTSIWACSGRLQAEPAAEVDLHEPEKKSRFSPHEVERPKVDETAFPFNNPVASSFVFNESEKLSQRSSPADRITLHNNTVSGTDSDDLPFSDAYHDPEEGSVTDSDTLSWDPEANVGPTHDSGRRSFDSQLISVVGLSSRGISSRALSGIFDMRRSGRFSVDLNRGQKLDKAQRLPSPDVRLRIFAGEKSYKRSIMSPCLPFLQKSPRKRAQPRIQQALSAAPSRRIQAVNSFTARLGPVAENPALAAQFHVQ